MSKSFIDLCYRQMCWLLGVQSFNRWQFLKGVFVVIASAIAYFTVLISTKIAALSAIAAAITFVAVLAKAFEKEGRGQ